MSEQGSEPVNSLRDRIQAMNRQELCAFVSELCKIIKNEVGNKAYRGGVFPENISLAEGGGFQIGPGKLADWGKEELQFIAPELYWNGHCSPASDVYSLGLLLYYGLTGGTLPFERESPNAQLSRMSGKSMSAPKNAGRLGEIIEKAIRFSENERYQNVEELQIMVESCMDNKYLDGTPGSELLFSKSGEELDDIERMMLSIIENDGPAKAEPIPAEAVELREEVPAEPLDEYVIGEILGTAPTPVPKEEPEDDPVKEFFGEADETDHVAVLEAEVAAADEPEDVRLYEPVTPKKDSKSGRPPIPILTEEKNPELAPVVPASAPRVQYTPDPERNKQVEEDVQKRRKRPVLVVLTLCVFLLLAAVGANFFLQNRSRVAAQDQRHVVMPTPEPESENGNTEGGQQSSEIVQPAEATPEPTETVETFYEVFKADVSWTEAQSRSRALGGHLVVINSQEELDEVVRLAENYGFNRLWIGGHRVDGTIVWETGETVDFLPWGQGEPSYYDNYDGVSEDYLLLWNNDGWVYNDSRNDPVSEYPEWYSGTIGYIVEFGT